MRISIQWLRSLLPLDDLTDTDLADRLTLLGLEVEGIELYESVRGGLAGVVVGHVLEVQPHPDADRLRVTRVEVGGEAPLQIVCGAPNVAQGQRVPVGLVGTTLYPTTGEPLTLRKAKIRGVESFGMICAEDELGLGSNHGGILVLDTDAAPGTPLDQVLPVYRDTILTIGLTPNRTDAMSHFGVARDLAAALDRELNLPDTSTAPLGAFPADIRFRVEATDRCPRYAGLQVQGLRVGPSPFWLQQRLLAVGQRPINNIVDLTNYILFEIGQPLHAFDASKIDGKELIINTLTAETDFAALDERSYRVGPDDLLIGDRTAPLCLAGIMGGTSSGVSEATTEIFVESAYFAPAGIRRTARRLGIHSETAYRFSRGTDPQLVVYALQRFAQLVGEIAGGRCSEIVDQRFSDFAPFEVEFSFARAWRLIGQELPRTEVEAILDRLSIVRQPTDDPDCLRLFVPRYRADVQRFQDVVEEILRVYGYNRIDPSPRLNAVPQATTDDSCYVYDERVADYLAANGFFEIRTNSLIAARYRSDRSVNMLNPLSEEHAVLRETMLLTGLEVIAHNLNRQQPDLRLFDMGKIYFSFIKDGQTHYAETQRLALYLTGRRQPAWWGGAVEAVDFFDLKGAVMGVAQLLGLELGESERGDDSELAWGQTYRLNKREVGRAGLVAPRWLKEAGIKQEVYFAELDWEALRAAAQQQRIQFVELPRFPAVRRDISLLLGGGTTFAQLAEAIRTCSPKLIRAVDLFDVYQPKGESRTSYALSVVLQDSEQTLTDERIQQVMDKIFAALRQNPDVELRV